MSGPQTMKVVSSQYPWPLFLLHREVFTSRGLPPKIIENRPKDITLGYGQEPGQGGYRGPVLIHTGKNPDPGFFNTRTNRFKEHEELPERIERLLPAGYVAWAEAACQLRGGIIGSATIERVVMLVDDPWYGRGQYGLVLSNIQRLPFFPLAGKPWLFDTPTAPIFEQLKHYCACCNLIEFVTEEEEETVGKRSCDCSIVGCTICGNCKKHCLCDIIFDRKREEKTR